MNVDFFEVVVWAFSPLAKIVQSYPGFVLSVFIPVFLYTFGISGWVMMPAIYPVYMAGLAANAEAVANGGQAMNIATQEIFINGWCGDYLGLVCDDVAAK